ncbi:MAG: excinuclease subunit, partial [Actinomycetota bacterium]|nr:excinuclease subunit [Actinomycetota bacterium]
DFAPAGDQPAAIESLTEGLEAGERFQTLLGITGSGKSFTVAGVIARAQRPTLVLAPNKSLAAQLTSEFREFFPKNRVEYFVSYYDYYQPEAYLPTTDTYIEKDSSINDEIDRLRHAATSGLLSRRDVIIVASVSAIYGLGAPDEYAHQLLTLEVGEERDQRSILSRMVDMGYERNDLNFVRNKFRVRGDTIEVFPAYEEQATRIQMFGDEIERIVSVDPVTGEVVTELDKLVMFPASHYVVSKTRMDRAVAQIEAELKDRLAELEGKGKLLEAQRLRMRTTYDLEMLREVGVCSGIENYSRHLDGRSAGQRPFTLLDYFPSDFLTVIDESHVAVPQLHGQFEGDRSRKDTLVEHGFRLPSAMDNRPLRFEEFTERIGQAIFMSATPSAFEFEVSSRVVEQIVRPTGLMDPQVVVRPTKGQIDDLVAEIRAREEADQRVLVTTLTKKMSEDLTEYLLELGIRVRYLHSDIDTIQRVEILRGLRLGEFDVLVGINLLREGLDLPEVSLVAILDADKEGFLRSETALIQTMGRAARNVEGQVIMYADHVTDSMRRAISETERRRGLQAIYNEEHGIDPQTIRKKVTDILEMIRGRSDDSAPVPAKGRRRMTARENARRQELLELPHDELGRLIQSLEEEMHQAATELRFEYAARLRDEINDLKRELREAG